MTTEEVCRKYEIENYVVNDDGSIDVDGTVNLDNLKLTELPLTFNKVSGDFFCRFNKLTTLKGSPRWVGDHFECCDNKLTSLDFSPEYVGGDFSCSVNNLTDLVGSPKEVGRCFYCLNNKKLTNPKGCPEKIGKLFYCTNTPLYSIFGTVDQDFLYAFNFNRIIKDDTVNLKRLKYVMDLYDKPINLDLIKKYYRIV